MADLDPDLLYEDLEAALRRDPDSQGKSAELKRWLFEQRFNYAWNFFDFHAKQRMSMFNYFLISVGFVMGTYFTLLKDGYCQGAAFLAVGGTVLTAIFLFLDRRNEELVHVAEAVLESLESDVLFTKYDREILWPMRRGFERMKEKRQKRPVGIFSREAADEKDIGRSWYRHGRWMPWFQLAIVVTFLVLSILPWLPKKITVCHYTIPIGIGTCK